MTHKAVEMSLMVTGTENRCMEVSGGGKTAVRNKSGQVWLADH